MTPASPESVVNQLRWRYATKKFDPTRKIPTEIWSQIEESMRLSPSSYGLQPWKFVVVSNPAIRTQLQAVAWNQPQIVDASHLVVFCVKKGMGPADADRLVARTAEVRGVPVESLKGYRDMMANSLGKMPAAEVDAWMSRQVYIALGVFLTTAALLGIDACPMEGFQPDQFDQILGLSAKGYGSVVLGAAGYRSTDDRMAAAAKVRYEAADILDHV